MKGKLHGPLLDAPKPRMVIGLPPWQLTDKRHSVCIQLFDHQSACCMSAGAQFNEVDWERLPESSCNAPCSGDNTQGAWVWVV